MQLNLNQTRNYLRESDFETLMIEELGWEYHTQSLTVTVDDTEYTLSAIAEKRGMVVFHCAATENAPLPNYATRRKIQRQVAESVHEHVIIYTDAAKTTQLWQWVQREPGKPDACREHRYHHKQAGDALLQKLETIAFSLEEEDTLTLPDVTGRVRAAFNVERVTKRFYERFKKEHEAFLAFLKGIPNVEMQRGVCLCHAQSPHVHLLYPEEGVPQRRYRLISARTSPEAKRPAQTCFTKPSSVPSSLRVSRNPKPNAPAATNQSLGEVPYLNGGIFQRHHIEQQHGETIQIPDKAFEQLFNVL